MFQNSTVTVQIAIPFHTYKTISSFTEAVGFKAPKLGLGKAGPPTKFRKVYLIYTGKLPVLCFHLCDGLCYNRQEAIATYSFHTNPFYWVVWSLSSIKGLKGFGNGYSSELGLAISPGRPHGAILAGPEQHYRLDTSRPIRVRIFLISILEIEKNWARRRMVPICGGPLQILSFLFFCSFFKKLENVFADRVPHSAGIIFCVHQINSSPD